MNDGSTWGYIRDEILPYQRYGATIIFVPIAIAPLAQPVIFPERPLEHPTPYIPEVTPQRLLFALRTNLVLDALTAVNLAAEVPIGKRWSVAAEVIYPWWRSWRCNYTMQIESYHAEVKYWLGNREKRDQLQGWSLGAYGGWGRYDIQPFSVKGVQGTFTDFGLQVGFAHPIARNLNLEYTIGLGYISTDYKNYKMVRDTEEFGDIKVIPYPWMNNTLRTILPTRVGISLVWCIKTKGGRR